MCLRSRHGRTAPSVSWVNPADASMYQPYTRSCLLHVCLHNRAFFVRKIVGTHTGIRYSWGSLHPSWCCSSLQTVYCPIRMFITLCCQKSCMTTLGKCVAIMCHCQALNQHVSDLKSNLGRAKPVCEFCNALAVCGALRDDSNILRLLAGLVRVRYMLWHRH